MSENENQFYIYKITFKNKSNKNKKTENNLKT